MDAQTGEAMNAQTGEARGATRKHPQQQNDCQQTKRPRQSLRNQQRKKRQQPQDAASKASNYSHPAISKVEIPPSGPTRTSSISLDDLPTPVLRMMGDFAGKKTTFNGCCKRVTEAFNQLHYRINMQRNARFFADCFGEVAGQHMGLQRPEGLSGRSVTHITVEGCTDLKNSGGGYQLLEKAVAKVVLRSIPTLRSISVKGRRGRDSGRVAAILAAMVPRSKKLMKDRVAPRLTRVELAHGADGLAKIGNAISAGLWPALEELIIPSCHANQRHMNHVAIALNAGHAPNLRTLDWGDQAVGSALADSMLLPLANGKCPHLESLSFAGNFVFHDRTMSNLTRALRACPKLRSLRMDCSITPNNQLRDLTAALHAGVAAKLETLYVRCTASCFWNRTKASPEFVQELLKAASSRRSEVRLNVKVISS